ncbi:MAG TPA: hypothetical protein VF444_22450 [Pseudonocardiaceae bacterium]
MTGPSKATRGSLRVLRGTLCAVAAAGLAVSAHAMGGGGLPDAGITVVLVLVVAAMGIALARRRLGRVTTVAVLGASQLTMHLVLTAAAPSGGMTDMPGMTGDTADPVPMIAWHVVAVLITAAVLSRADAAIFALVAVLSMLLPRRLPPASPPSARSGTRSVLPAGVPSDPVREVLLRRVNARRGPPRVRWE